MDDITSIVEKIIRNFNHELKNPLTTIKGYAQLLGSKADNPQFVEKSRNIIIENVDDIDSKMNHMYDIFNLPRGVREPINPEEIINDFISSCNEKEKQFLLIENISNIKSVIGDQNYFRKIIDILFHGFDWVNHPKTRLSFILNTDGSNHITLLFTFENADFTHLSETNFYLPFSEKRYFNTGIELFEVYYLSFLSGWSFSFRGDTRNSFLLNLK